MSTDRWLSRQYQHYRLDATRRWQAQERQIQKYHLSRYEVSLEEIDQCPPQKIQIWPFHLYNKTPDNWPKIVIGWRRPVFHGNTYRLVSVYEL